MIKGKVFIYSKDKIFTYNNLVTNESKEFLAGAAQGNYKITHMYGQWGENADFPEGTGPFFTPLKTNTVADLTGVNYYTIDAQMPITSFSQNEGELNCLSFMTKNDNKIYIGVGLVCELPNKKLLLGHIALNGVLKKPEADLAILWKWTFEN